MFAAEAITHNRHPRRHPREQRARTPYSWLQILTRFPRHRHQAITRRRYSRLQTPLSLSGSVSTNGRREGAQRMADIYQRIEAEIPRLRRYARALTRDVSGADDLVQDCLA